MLVKSINSSHRTTILLKSIAELITDPGTISMTGFTLSIILFKYVATGYWYLGNEFGFHFLLMIGIVLIPSYITLRRIFVKMIPKDRTPFPNNWKKEYIIPRILAVVAMWIILATELYGLGIYVFSVMPDVFDIPKTPEMEQIILSGTVYGALYIPAMTFYWFYLINKKEFSRKALFSNKWRT